MQKIIRYAFILFSLVFLLGYIVIVSNNVYYGDDLHFIYNIREYGFINVAKNLFFHFECPLTLPFHLLLLSLSSKLGGVASLNLFISTTNILSLYLVLGKLLKQYLTKGQAMLLSLFVIALLYSCTRSIGQLSTIFWADGQLPYVLPMTYLFLWGYFFLSHKIDRGKLNLHFLGLLSLVLMNTKLNYCLFFLTYIFAINLYSFVWSKKDVLYKGLNNRNLILFLFALVKKKENIILLSYTVIGLAFYVLNPGNFERMKFDGQSPLSSSPVDYIKAILIGQKHFYLLIISSPRFLVVLTLLIIFVISHIKLKVEYLTNWRGLLIHFLAFSISLSLQSVLTQAVFGTAIYQGRIFFLSEFLFLLLFAHTIYFLYQHYLIQFNKRWIYLVSLPVILFILTAQFIYFYSQIKIVREFKTAYDLRMNLIRSEKLLNRTEPLYLDELPSSGVLGVAEISLKEQMNDSKVYYENLRIENYYGLQYKVYLKENSK